MQDQIKLQVAREIANAVRNVGIKGGTGEGRLNTLQPRAQNSSGTSIQQLQAARRITPLKGHNILVSLPNQEPASVTEITEIADDEQKTKVVNVDSNVLIKIGHKEPDNKPQNTDAQPQSLTLDIPRVNAEQEPSLGTGAALVVLPEKPEFGKQFKAMTISKLFKTRIGFSFKTITN